MELNKKSFKRMFPNLANEMESDESKADINSVRTDRSLWRKSSLNKVRSLRSRRD